eukprot:tig00000241_g21066.t1
MRPRAYRQAAHPRALALALVVVLALQAAVCAWTAAETLPFDDPSPAFLNELRSMTLAFYKKYELEWNSHEFAAYKKFIPLAHELLFGASKTYFSVGVGRLAEEVSTWMDLFEADKEGAGPIQIHAFDPLRPFAWERRRWPFYEHTGVLSFSRTAVSANTSGLWSCAGIRCTATVDYWCGALLISEICYDLIHGPQFLPTITIPEYMEHFRIDKIDVMQLDAEGFDPVIIRSLEPLLAQRRIRAFYFEYGPHWTGYAGDVALGRRAEAPSVDEMHEANQTLKEVVRFLGGYNFAVFLIGWEFLLPISGALWRDEYELNWRPVWAPARPGRPAYIKHVVDLLVLDMADPLALRVLDAWHHPLRSRTAAFLRAAAHWALPPPAGAAPRLHLGTHFGTYQEAFVLD